MLFLMRNDKRWKTKLEIFQSVGCLANVQVPIPKKVKIGPKIVDYGFIEYVPNSKACLCFVHKSENLNIHDNTVMESSNVEFFKHIYPYETVLESSSGRESKEP